MVVAEAIEAEMKAHARQFGRAAHVTIRRQDINL
jgi:hypothetical protein